MSRQTNELAADSCEALSGEADRAPCPCAWAGCPNAGAFRAPKDRQLREYYLLCLDHVRTYNAKWDFHAGLSPNDMEAEFRSAATWDRPTWKLGSKSAGIRPERLRTHDPFGFMDEFERGRRRQRRTAAGSGQSGSTAEQAALAERAAALQVLHLNAPFTLEELKRCYKILVKKHHPDANGGSPAAGDQMKVINQAYQTLRATIV